MTAPLRLLAVVLFLGLPALVAAESPKAQFISQVVPDRMIAGQRYAVVVQYKNAGRKPWPAAVRLRQVGSRAWGRIRAREQSGKAVGPGETATFRVTLTAPRRPGRYTLRWRPILAQRLFGPSSPPVQVEVTAAESKPAWNAEFIHQSLPSLQDADPPYALLQVGHAYPVTLVFKNTGRRPWRSGEVRLVPLGRNAATLWSVAALDLPSGTQVAPGEIHTFRFNLLAPLEPGIYPFQWRLQRRGRPFGPATPKVMITVR